MSKVSRLTEMPARRLAEIFPKTWIGGVITAASAGEWWGDGKDTLDATYGVIGIIDAHRTRLAALRSAGDDPIRGITDLDAAAPTARMLMAFCSTDTFDDPPTGVLDFNLGMSKGATSGRIDEMHIQLLHAWVDPLRRRQGYGKHLVAHCLNYIELRLASVCACRVATDGLRVIVSAKCTSPGGRRLVEQIHRHFTLMNEGDAEHRIVATSTWQISDAQISIDTPPKPDIRDG